MGKKQRPGSPVPEDQAPGAPKFSLDNAEPSPDNAESSPNNPKFSLDDFVQGPTNSPDEPEFRETDSTDDFSWFQDAIEQESEDVAAWGASPDSDEEFVWFQEARPELAASAAHGGALGQGQVPPASTTRGTAAADPSAADTLTRTQARPSASDIPATAATPAPAQKPSPVSAKQSHFRPEIEGLRAVAVFMIVVYHVWLGRVSGGVDVFLFISAFLLGSSFARRLDARGSFAPVKYWLRTFTRLMPPAVIAICGTLIGSYFILPPSAWQNVITHAIASATYVQNIVLGQQAVDYYAQDASQASPLQHFWSLSLQGQVFLTWPLIFMLVARVAKSSRHPRRAAAGVFGVIALASFAYSVWFTATDQSAAYFSTPARLWEVSAGTLLALALPRLDRVLGAHRPGSGHEPRFRTLRAIAGWAGFALLVSLGILLDVQGLFPGWIAIWPLAGAVLIIVAGYSGSRWGFDRILTMKLPRALASSSYSLYLVHWPILILWLTFSGQQRAGLADGLAVIAGSMLVAWALSKVVDAQFRSPVWKSAPPLRSLAVIGLCLALVLGGSLGWRQWLAGDVTQDEVVTADTPTASPTVDPLAEPFNAAALSPKGHELGGQWPNLPYSCGQVQGAPKQHPHSPCQLLRPMDDSWDKLVFVVGSSHARQFIPALMDSARTNNWQIINLSMHGCTFRQGHDPNGRCGTYYDYVMTQIKKFKPDFVVTVGTAAKPSSNAEVVEPGAKEAIQAILNENVPVIAFRDPPRWPANAYTCAEAVVRAGGTREDADSKCGANVSLKLAATSPLKELESMRAVGASDAGGAAPARVYTIDLTDRICPDGRCSPILGNTYVYMDDNHLTRAFTTAIAPDVAERVKAAGITSK